ncbi:MAG: methyltransferase domain-containing protein [Chloroflexota bacterium]
MFEIVDISLATTNSLFKFKNQFEDLKGFGLKAFDNGWMLNAHQWKAGEKVLDVGGAYSWVPLRIQSQYGCEVWVADDFGKGEGDPFWERNRSPQEYIHSHPEIKFVLERIGHPENSAYPEKYFDVVYSISALEHVPDRLAPAVWHHMARLIKPDGELIHAIDLPFPSNGGLKLLLKIIAFDMINMLLPEKIRLEYLRISPLNYVSVVCSTLGIPRKSFSKSALRAIRMALDPEVVAESYEHTLNRITKDDPDTRYQRAGSLLIHLKSKV